MIIRTGPFYKKRPSIGDVWRKGLLQFKILDFHFFNDKELVLMECCESSLSANMIGRRTFESIYAFGRPYWRKISNGRANHAYC